MAVRLSKSLFIEKATKKHEGKYSYQSVEYINTYTPVTIHCKKHGEFLQRPDSHMAGQGCRTCQSEGMSLTYGEFLSKAKLRHGNRYDYSQTTYLASKLKVKIICRLHGEFTQTPDSHLRGAGCRVCYLTKKGLDRRLTTNTFIEKARLVHGNFYNYDAAIYFKSTSKVVIGCPRHGNWLQVPASHLGGSGCPNCGIEASAASCRRTNSEFVELAVSVHGQRYTYDRVEYVNSNTKVTVGCKTHGHWGVIANDHIAGRGCPRCSRSKGEEYLSRLFTELGVVNIDQFKLPELNVRYRYDFYLPEHNVLIEYQGGQHYRAIEFFGGEEGFRKTLERDAIKKHLAKETGRKLVYLSYLDMAEARGRYPKFRAIVLRKLSFLKQRLPEGSVKFGDNL